MKSKFLPLAAILAVAVLLVGFYTQDPTSSRSPVNQTDIQNPVVPQTNAIVKYVDSLNGANDSISLKNRGYKVRRGALMGPPGSNNGWFQGNATVFPAFNGPTTGYVAANFNTVSGTNTIDLWLISPTVNANAGDTISFYTNAPDAGFVDSIRVHWASNGDTMASTGSWTELGKFKVTNGWTERRFVVPTAGATGRFAINYRVVNGGPSGANSDYIGVDFIRLLGPAAPPLTACSLPELLYYKFENNTPTTTPNSALTPVGTNPSPYTGTLSNQGMYDSCILGTGATGTTGILPGWNCNLGTGQWTIGFFVSNLNETSAGQPTYLFGDPGAGSFRCFYGGFALPNNIVLRGPFTDIIFACPMPGSYYFHIVYDGANIIVYRNGVQLSSTPAVVNLPTGTGFRVAGYTGGAFGLNAGGRMDEFRLYNRALTPAFVTGSWNMAELPGCLTNVSNVNTEIPKVYSLSQNYPNPFNPVTNIKFSIPNSGLVKLAVFDVLGREVATLVNEVKPAGNYVADFDASTLASGVYFYSLTSGDFTQTKKMLLVK